MFFTSDFTCGRLLFQHLAVPTRPGRDEWLQAGDWAAEELKKYEQQWIDLYGEQAQDEALKQTQQAYDEAKRKWPTYHLQHVQPYASKFPKRVHSL